MMSSPVAVGLTEFIMDGGASSITGFHESLGAISPRPLRFQLSAEKKIVTAENNFRIAFADEHRNYIFVVNVLSENATAAWNFKAILLRGRTAEAPACASTHLASWQTTHRAFLMNWPPGGISPQISIIESDSREEVDCEEMEAERLGAINELIQALPSHEVLLRWARENPPPQDWFDEDYGLL